VLILGAGGNVGTYAAQLATGAGVQVEKIVDRSQTFESLSGFDVVLDTVGGDAQRRSLRVLKPGGILVSAVSAVPEDIQKARGVRAAYFYVEVTTARLKRIAGLFESGKLSTHVGTVLPLEDARVAHEMLEGAPHKPGKIVLQTAG
jgi:NADPH:quinone reductase-like Zn-dependent oxidoreductase